MALVTDWRAAAACRNANPALFDATDHATAYPVAAAFCTDCPVLQTCREWAASETQWTGVAGGLVYTQCGSRRRAQHPTPPRPAYVPELVGPHCGTERGYQRHRTVGVPACSPCKAAHARHWLDRQRKDAA